MRPITLLLWVIASCGGSTAKIDAGVDAAPPVPCWGDPRTMQDRACMSSSDCAVIAHQSDCCGTLIEEGVRVDEVDAVHNAETMANAGCSLCKCTPLATTDDEGQMGGAYLASCDDTGLCTAHAQ